MRGWLPKIEKFRVYNNAEKVTSSFSIIIMRWVKIYDLIFDHSIEWNKQQLHRKGNSNMLGLSREDNPDGIMEWNHHFNLDERSRSLRDKVLVTLWIAWNARVKIQHARIRVKLIMKQGISISMSERNFHSDIGIAWTLKIVMEGKWTLSSSYGSDE